ncbi:MAG: alpha/beta hydrolase [Pseudomonadota bacterium]
MKRVMILLLLVTLASSLGACVHSVIYTSNVENAYPPEGEQFNVNGAGVHVIRAGDANGAPVLFIHGASANANEFKWTLAPRLEDQFDLMLADRPGHGYSDRPDGAHMLEIQAAQMAGVLERLSPDEPAVVVGHSFGGAVALRLALDHPERVKGLVLLAPVSHDWGGGGQAWYNTWATTPVLGPVFSNIVPLVGPGRAETGAVSTFHPAPVPENYTENSATNLLFRPPTFRANARDVMALREELTAQQSRYGELSMPVVLFSGSQDTVILPQLHAGRLKDEVGDITLVKLPDEGHMPHHREGEQIAQAIARLASAR